MCRSERNRGYSRSFSGRLSNRNSVLVRFGPVSGHDFSRAVKHPKTAGFSPCASINFRPITISPTLALLLLHRMPLAPTSLHTRHWKPIHNNPPLSYTSLSELPIESSACQNFCRNFSSCWRCLSPSRYFDALLRAILQKSTFQITAKGFRMVSPARACGSSELQS